MCVPRAPLTVCNWGYLPTSQGPQAPCGKPMQRSPARCLRISKPPTISQLLRNARGRLSDTLSRKVLSECALALPAWGRDHSQDVLSWGAHSLISLKHTSGPQPEAGAISFIGKWREDSKVGLRGSKMERLETYFLGSNFLQLQYSIL